MNKTDLLEKIKERVTQNEATGMIKNKEQLLLFINGYIQGISEQYSYICMTKEEKKEIEEWVKNYYLENFYFTFGSYRGFPFKNGYIIVRAETIREAAYKFMQEFPNQHDEDVVNCSDYYTEHEWQQRVGQYYRGREPFLVLK